ncbi:MAG: hypothetical protein WDW38_005896 [Sanguina aurantia]
MSARAPLQAAETAAWKVAGRGALSFARAQQQVLSSREPQAGSSCARRAVRRLRRVCRSRLDCASAAEALLEALLSGAVASVSTTLPCAPTVSRPSATSVELLLLLPLPPPPPPPSSLLEFGFESWCAPPASEAAAAVQASW